MLDNVPVEFHEAKNEPAFSVEYISFCFWRLYSDSGWQRGPLEFHHADDPDGSEFLLECLDARPGTYQDFVEEYYEEDIPLAPIRHIYSHQPITSKVLDMLNPSIKMKDTLKELHEIGYPT